MYKLATFAAMRVVVGGKVIGRPVFGDVPIILIATRWRGAIGAKESNIYKVASLILIEHGDCRMLITYDECWFHCATPVPLFFCLN
jgi:hypothetical protein